MKSQRGDAHPPRARGHEDMKRADGKLSTKTESQSVRDYQRYGWKVEYSTESEEGFSKKA